MQHPTFKQFESEVREQIQLCQDEVISEGLDEGVMINIAQKIGTALADFRKKFKRAPTPQEAFAMRKKLRDANLEMSRQKLAQDRERNQQNNSARQVMRPQGAAERRGSQARGQADVQDWIANL